MKSTRPPGTQSFALLCLFTSVAAAQTTLTSGVAQSVTIPAVSSITLLSGAARFRIDVPSGASRLEVRLSSVPATVQYAIGVRVGSDFSTTTFNNQWGGISGQSSVVITPSSTPPLTAGTYYIGILVVTNSTQATASITATVTTAPVPAIDSANGVVNGASFLSGIASGSWFSIRGTNLASTTRIWNDADFQGGRLPISLEGVSVKINNRDALVYFISPTQINALAPADGATGSVSVVVTNSLGTSAAAQGAYQRFAPALFAFDPQNRTYPAAVHPNGAYVGPPGLFGSAAATLPARQGGRILLFGAGFGPTTPVTDPAVTQASTALLATPNDLRILIGGIPATIEFAGMVSNGLYQFNIVVPNVPDGDQTLVAEIGGQRSQSTLRLSVAGNPPPQASGLEYLQITTGATWDYRVDVPATASLPYKPVVEEPAGLLCSNVFCGTQSWNSGQFNFRLTAGAKISSSQGDSWRLTTSAPGGRFFFGTESWPLDLRVSVRNGVPQLDILAAASATLRLARLLARLTPEDLASRQTLTVGGRQYNDVVRTTVTQSRDGIYLGQDYTSEVFLAPGAGIIRAILRDASSRTLFTLELTQFTAP